jgi:hypothetical protein
MLRRRIPRVYSKHLMSTLTLLFAACWASFGAPPPQSLSSEEKRAVAANLAELKASREHVRTLEDYIDRLKSLEGRETALSAKELEAEHRLRLIAERERDVEKARGDQMEAALKLRNRKPGFGCTLKRILTIGLGRCG